MFSSTYFCSRGSVRCWTASSSAPRVPHFLDKINTVREEACFSSSNVYCAMYNRSSTLISTVGREVVCDMFVYGRASMVTIPKSTLGGGIELRVVGSRSVWARRGGEAG